MGERRSAVGRTAGEPLRSCVHPSIHPSIHPLIHSRRSGPRGIEDDDEDEEEDEEEDERGEEEEDERGEEEEDERGGDYSCSPKSLGLAARLAASSWVILPRMTRSLRLWSMAIMP